MTGISSNISASCRSPLRSNVLQESFSGGWPERTSTPLGGGVSFASFAGWAVACSLTADLHRFSRRVRRPAGRETSSSVTVERHRKSLREGRSSASRGPAAVLDPLAQSVAMFGLTAGSAGDVADARRPARGADIIGRKDRASSAPQFARCTRGLCERSSCSQ
jgi:hypothetical protein